MKEDYLIIEEGIDPSDKDLKIIGHRINNLYYNNGATPMFCKSNGPIIGYGQGRCVGGSTFINAGYFSETPESIFNQWIADKSIDFSYFEYQKYIDEIKKELGVTLIKKNSNDIDSNNIFYASKKLNWKINYCDRFITENLNKKKCLIGDASCDIHNCEVHEKQSMNVTYLKKPIKNNKLLCNFKVVKILTKNGFAKSIIARNQNNKKIKIFFKKLFINCGPINSYSLLKKNNLLDNNLSNADHFEFHLNFKIIVKFNSKVNSNFSKSSSFFIREFEKEGVLFSTSNSELPYLLASLSHYDTQILKDLIRNYHQYSMYVYQIKSFSKGKVINSFGSSFVRYFFDQRDYFQLQLGIKNF